jgi:hypothetical protein
MPFPCDVNGPGARSRFPPSSVHQLTPGDIDIVAAIGDSLTSAQGVWATDLMGIFVEGRSFLIWTFKNFKNSFCYQEEVLVFPSVDRAIGEG